MTFSCLDCKFFKIMYKNTLIGQAYCTKFDKVIPASHFAYNFFCVDDYNEPT